MKFITTLLIIISAIACGKDDAKKPVDTWTQLDEINYLVDEVYLKDLPTLQDKDGFVETDHCDALLWSSLIGATGIPVNVEAAEVSSGRWLRRPISYEECYRAGKSRSTISRDMLLGVMWWALKSNNLNVLERMYTHCDNNRISPITQSCVVGDGDKTRTTINPTLKSTLAKAIDKLGGKRHTIADYNDLWPFTPRGYEAHLQVLHILLLGEIKNGISEAEFKAIKRQVEREPNNALFQAAFHKYSDGDQTQAVKLIIDRYPHDRLPTSKDWCDSWPVQRDYADLKPCDEGRTHTAGEVVFIRSLIAH